MRFFTRIDRHARLVGRMAGTLGIDLTQAAMAGEMPPEALRSAVLRCTGCERAGACESWLAVHDSAAETPAYCRNKSLFDRLAAEAGEPA